jgi:hypothetical protein
MAHASLHETHAIQNPPLETKRTPLRASIGADGAFEGYASLFGLRDSCGDIVAPGAFAQSLRRRGAADVKMLWQHRPDEPIGVWREIGEDSRGLKVTGRLDLSVGRAREALSLIRAGALDGLSIGFRTLRSVTDRAIGARRLLEIDLMEISIVTFPALPQARIGATPGAAGAVIVEAAQKRARLRMRAAAARFQNELSRSSSLARAAR